MKQKKFRERCSRATALAFRREPSLEPNSSLQAATRACCWRRWSQPDRLRILQLQRSIGAGLQPSSYSCCSLWQPCSSKHPPALTTRAGEKELEKVEWDAESVEITSEIAIIPAPPLTVLLPLPLKWIDHSHVTSASLQLSSKYSSMHNPFKIYPNIVNFYKLLIFFKFHRSLLISGSNP